MTHIKQGEKEYWECTVTMPPETEFKLLRGNFDGGEKCSVDLLQWQTGDNLKIAPDHQSTMMISSVTFDAPQQSASS